MKLLIEQSEQDIECLVENTSQGKQYFLEGRWATANEANKNGRIYPSRVMEGALQKYNETHITQRRALGELNHPPGPTVNLDRASHIIENLKMEGNYVVGRAKVMNTPMGVIAKNLIDEGVKLGVSTRGLGSLVSKNGLNEVQGDFFISAIDLVSDPSGPGCFPAGVIAESIDYQLLEDGRIIELVVDSAKKRIDEKKAMRAFAQLMLEHSKKYQN